VQVRRDRFSQATAMSTIPYTLSYMWLDQANDLGIPYASFYSKNGVTLEPTYDNVMFSVIEKGGPGSLTVDRLLDLTVPNGPYSWPMTAYAWMVVRKLAFRETCAINLAMLEFMLWYYTSSAAITLANNLAFSLPPTQTIAQWDIITLINTEVYCGGSLVLPAENSITSDGIGTEFATELFELYPSVYSSLVSDNGTIDYLLTESDAALERLMWGEVDFIISVASSMDQTELELALESGEVIQLPLFLSRFVQIHSLPTISSTDTVGLILDYATLSDIWQGKVWMWNDPRIAALNPALAAADMLPALNITR
jgi:ABC-type phosphate transport system substrate-binding protein